jgi:WD40 repeat protein
MSAYASCYDEKSNWKFIGSNRSRTSVLISPDGRYRAYAESEAGPSQAAKAASDDCQNTSRLFVAGPKSPKFRQVLVVEPSPEARGNSIYLIDWSPNGHRLLLAQGFWQWGSDVGGMMVRIYDADSENLSREFFVNEAFSRYVGKNCAGVFHPVGFSSSGKVIVTAGPFFDVGEDKPVEDSCVQKEGFWLIDSVIPAVSQLPDNYKVQRYGKVAP